MVTMGYRWWALAMMGVDIPMVLVVMMEELDRGIDLTCIPLGWVRVTVSWDDVLPQVGGHGQGGVGGLHPGGIGEVEVGPVGLTGPTWAGSRTPGWGLQQVDGQGQGGLEVSILMVLVRVRLDKVARGYRCWALAMMGKDVPLVMEVVTVDLL